MVFLGEGLNGVHGVSGADYGSGPAPTGAEVLGANTTSSPGVYGASVKLHFNRRHTPEEIRFKCNSLLYLNRGLPGSAVYDLSRLGQARRHATNGAGLF